MDIRVEWRGDYGFFAYLGGHLVAAYCRTWAQAAGRALAVRRIRLACRPA